jgi:hypothetical protein
VHLAETYLEHRGRETSAGSSADRYQVVVHIDQAVLTEASAAEHTEPHRCELDDGPALALDTARRLACDAAIVGVVEGVDGEPLDVGRKTRSIPPALARALKARDGGCRFPGCDRTRFTEGHHVKHWADGGETKLSNLVTLCTRHHGLVHEGGFGLTVTDDGENLVIAHPYSAHVQPRARIKVEEERDGAELSISIRIPGDENAPSTWISAHDWLAPGSCSCIA